MQFRDCLVVIQLYFLMINNWKTFKPNVNLWSSCYCVQTLVLWERVCIDWLILGCNTEGWESQWIIHGNWARSRYLLKGLSSKHFQGQLSSLSKKGTLRKQGRQSWCNALQSSKKTKHPNDSLKMFLLSLWSFKGLSSNCIIQNRKTIKTAMFPKLTLLRKES